MQFFHPVLGVHQGFEPRSVNKIASNPEKPKHLETVTMMLTELDIDFVGLGSERYFG